MSNRKKTKKTPITVNCINPRKYRDVSVLIYWQHQQYNIGHLSSASKKYCFLKSISNGKMHRIEWNNTYLSIGINDMDPKILNKNTTAYGALGFNAQTQTYRKCMKYKIAGSYR